MKISQCLNFYVTASKLASTKSLLYVKYSNKIQLFQYFWIFLFNFTHYHCVPFSNDLYSFFSPSGKRKNKKIQNYSGVATLSITDSSATSSEDTSNPDSPDNNAINNELHHHSLNGSKSPKQNLQVPNNNNSSSPNKNKQVFSKRNTNRMKSCTSDDSMK